MKTQKLQKTSHLFSVFLTAGCIIMGISIILLAIGTLVTIFIPLISQERFQDISDTLSQIVPAFTFSQYIFFLVCCIGILMCIFFILYHALKIFSCIGKGVSPFTKTTSSQIRKIAAWIIIYGIISLFSIFKISFASFLLCCLFALIMLCISLIFDYGCTLQQEVDELL